MSASRDLAHELGQSDELPASARAALSRVEPVAGPPGRSGGSSPVLSVVAASAVAGAAIAVLGTRATDRAPYYAAVFGLLAAAALIALTRREPLRFVFLGLIAAFPVAGALVPPGRLGVTVFELASLVLAAGVLWTAVVTRGRGAPIFPTSALLAAWLLLAICVALSQNVVVSLRAVVSVVALHAFFLFACAELRRESGFERLVVVLCVATLAIGVGLFVDHWGHVNLSLRGSNPNQLTYVGGVTVWRAGGFFQDPQRAGAYLAATVSFLLVLAARKRFPSRATTALLWLTVAIGGAGLLLTISRGAIAAFALVSSGALLLFNRWSVVTKTAVVLCPLLAAAAVATLPAHTFDAVVPAVLEKRFGRAAQELDIRQTIWADTADMFFDHPITGIGPGGFRSYLIATRPGRVGYYGIGSPAELAYVPDQPESGYLKILYEGGLVGALAFLLLIGDLLRRGVGGARRHARDSAARTELIAALCGIAALGATFVTLYTVGDPRIAAVFALLYAMMIHRSERVGLEGRGG